MSSDMNVSIKMFPAKNGDSFIISFGYEIANQTHILIDCGFVETYVKYIKDELLKISDKGECIEKLIVTHIDADHIAGTIKLLKENNSKKFIFIRQIWHNTFRHLFEEENINTDKKQEKVLHQLIQRGYPMNEKDALGEQKISAEQGTTVGALILQGKYSWNSDFNNNAVSVDCKREIVINEDAKIFLLSPDKQKLEKLKDFWKDELRKYSINYEHGSSPLYDDAFEMLLSWERETPKRLPKHISLQAETVDELLKRQFSEDETVTNGSSIAFILHIRENKFLFLADAHPDLIVKSLKEYKKDGVIMFDLIKVSHHGSFSNVSSALLEKIDAPEYLVSTNGGRHNHPDKETIAHIISRPVGFHRKIHFNYITNNSKYFDRDDWMKKYDYSIHYLNQAPYLLSL